MVSMFLIVLLVLGTHGAINESERLSGEWLGNTTSDRLLPERQNTTADELLGLRHQLDEENFVTEDDESFQEAEDSVVGAGGGGCREAELAEFSVVLCAAEFERQVDLVPAEERCLLRNVIGAYDKLTVCLESLSHWCGCFYPNPSTQAAFLRVHSAFFARCPRADGGEEERHLRDAPREVAVGLTLAPVALVPFLVYLVGWRSGAGEPGSRQ
ncbi:receptor activity-modifying protein 1-like [Corythoichthys intestinalis]|uniref:receptor activity-modifying protein 1-like n=1 Tax=Corythoichthys intestinalis TaxID=161448 RepID=UPI0025A5F47F|nr:receptor activity-modifying protein 1-like [Corythoichthys intestinalis]